MQMAAVWRVHVDDGRLLRTSDVHVDDAATAVFRCVTEAERTFTAPARQPSPDGNWPKRSERHLNFQRAQSAAKRRRRDSQFLTAVCSPENRPSNRKAVQQLGWQPKGTDMLDTIRVVPSWRKSATGLKREYGLERARKKLIGSRCRAPAICIRLVAPGLLVCTRT